MGNKINIVELLKDAPFGTKLYSPLVGECILQRVRKDGAYPIVAMSVRTCKYASFDMYGRYLYYEDDGECLLFPSKDCRTWENFKAPWSYRHFAPFQQILYKEQSYGKWQAGLYSHYQQEEDKVEGHKIIGKEEYVFGDDLILPYSGNEDKLGKETE